MYGDVDSALSTSGMVENVRLVAEMVSPSLSVQKLFPLPVCITVLRYRRRPTSGHVDSTKSRSSMVENVGGSR